MKYLEKFKEKLKIKKEKVEEKPKKHKKMKKSHKIIIVAVCAVVVIALGTGIYLFSTKKTSSDTDAGTSVVMMGSVIDSITGSGTVEPIEQREIVPLVNGKIVEASFEEGDSVKTGDVLYKFEMTSAENAIETAQNNVQKAQTSLANKASNIKKVEENMAKLTVRATASGKVSGLSLNVGEDASGKICTVTNYKEQTATIPFSAAQIDKIKVGDSATVSIEKYMMNVSGKVVRKYSASEILSSGAVTYNVEIVIGDNYTVEENVNVTATVHTSDGDVKSASYGSIKYASPVSINAEQKGKVSSVYVKNGDWVNKGDTIVVLTNDDLSDELKTARQSYTDAQMSLTEAESNLEDKQEAAANHIVTSPIDGTVLTKSYTVGDTVSGQNATTMMVVADMSKMKFTISVDELDIAKIKLGQSVSVTADALENQRLQGTITSVSKSGTASNGVTTYPVEVTIDDPGNLMSGMNVSAQIIVERADNCLYLPVSAVEYYGGKYYVTVVGEVENMPEMPQRQGRPSQTGDNEENASQGEEMPQRGERPEGEMPQRGQRTEGEMPQRGQRTEGEMPQRGEKSEGETPQQSQRPEGETPQRGERTQGDSANASEGKSEGNKSGQNGENELKIKLYDKEKRVEVEVGISNDEYYEIKSGVSFGQVVKNTTQATGSSTSRMPGSMGGGMPGGMGGGMPGGMSGGMPGNMGGGMSRGMSGGMSGGSMGGRR